MTTHTEFADIATLTEAAHREATVTAIGDIANILQDALGQKMVAFMVGNKDPKTIGRWASGQTAPDSDDSTLLRNAFQVFALLQTRESKQTIKAWFAGMNPQLNDSSPAEALAEGRKTEVMLAARAFVASG